MLRGEYPHPLDIKIRGSGLSCLVCLLNMATNDPDPSVYILARHYLPIEQR